MPGRPGPFGNLTRFPKLTTMRTYFRRQTLGQVGIKPGLVNFLYQFTHRINEVKRISKPVYAAAVLLLLSAGLAFTVVSGLSQQIRPLPPLAAHQQPLDQPIQVEQPVPPAQVTPAVPAPVAVTTPMPMPEAARTAEQPSIAPVVPAAEVALQQEKRRQPLAGEIVAGFGWQHHAVYQDWRFHTGIDIAATPGQPVRAATGGRVASVAADKQFGLMLVVESGSHTLYYGSLSSAAVKAGQTVHTGDVIGVAGECSSEPFTHLHFAVKAQDNYIDPQEFLK